MNKQKLIGTIIGIVLFIVAIAGLSYAYISWTSDDMNKVVSSKCFNVFYDKGADFTGNIMPSDDYTGGISVTVKMDIDASCNINAKGKLYINTDTTTSSNLYTEGVLNYQVLINGKLTDLKGNITSSGDTVIDVGFLNKNASVTTTYTIYVWINKYYITNEHANSAFLGSVRSEAVQTTEDESKVVNLNDYITSLYVKGNPTLITQATSNDSYYYSYQDDSSTWGLMNDGLKVDTTLDATTTGLATTVTDTTALTTGTEGNIRYFGPSASVNNYIYFNCSDYSNQSDITCEKWRIIGIVDNKVKIIRNDSIGNLAWDQDKNQDSSLTTYNNNWVASSLQEFLNGLYYNRGTKDEHTYYSDSSGTTTKTLYLSDIGITEATRGMISESIWYLGGYTSGVYPNEIYTYERTNTVGTTIYSGNPFTITANIGLMYASDYGYATDLSKCRDKINSYNSSTDSYACRTNNWLFDSANQWLITPHSSYASLAWSVTSSGGVKYISVYNAYGVRPVLYLNSELGMESGHAGTNTDPYQLLVN